MMNKIHVKTGDTVMVLSGKDKGKKGKVLSTSPKSRKVIVEGINIIKKHQKPRQQGETGGIIEREAAMHACKVNLFCTKCNKATRIAHKIEGDKKTRVCKHCGVSL